MRKFYIEQILGTVAIVGTWVLALVLLTGDKARQPLRPVTPAAVQREQVEPRDEKTGEEARVHRFNEEGQRVEMEVKFKDKTRGLVTFNMMGSPSKAEEHYPNGTRQVFFFTRDGGLRKRQSFRKDNSLQSETVPAAEGSMLTRRLAEDGKTLLSTEQVFVDGSFETIIYGESGKTPHLRYRQNKAGDKSVLTSYDAQGKVKTVENIERDPNSGSCGDPMCHECGGEVKTELVRHRPDGTIWYKQNWTSAYGNETVHLVEEFQSDGKTLVKRAVFNSELLPKGMVEDGDVAITRLELFDAKGNLRAVRLLRSDDTVVREQTIGTDGEPTDTKYFKKDAGVKESLNYAEPGQPDVRDPNHFREVLPQVTPQPEPNHLQQMMSR